MTNVKKINLFVCLVFSFIFLFGKVFLVEARPSTREIQTLEMSLDCTRPDEEVVTCTVDYTTLDNVGQKVIYRINNVDCGVRNIPTWRESDNYDYACTSNYKISDDDKSMKVYVKIVRYKNICIFIPIHDEEFNLTFELKVN